ncbi:MAG: AAA family ATPase [Bacteroidales bacterium]|nr:AAA family ATPase [Bacteroidales bacterium]
MEQFNKKIRTEKSIISIVKGEKEMNSFNVFSTYDDEIHPGKMFIHLYNELFDTYSIYNNINIEQFINRINEKYKLLSANYLLKQEFSKRKKIDEIDYTSCSYLIKIKEKLLVAVSNYKIVFYYASSISFDEIKAIIELARQSKKEKKHKRKFYMVSANAHSEYGFEFRKFNIKKQALNIQENYNDDFVEVDAVIQQFLSAQKSNGLVLLHGKYGTGKTSYIRNLMSTVNKRFIFLPVNMMESISSPNFLPFISKYNNSILVLEDCETIIKQRESGNSDSSLVNLLNLGDGLLSDALSIKLICTFNADLKQIDQAILRKGRLVARYEFKELDTKKADFLYKKIGGKEKIDKPKTLAEIYNFGKKNFGEDEQNQKIGF